MVAPVIRVLVVEDDLYVARMLARRLSRHFDIVDVVDDAETALLRLDVDHVDLVLTDLDLGPGRPDGIALACRIAERSPDLPIILASATLDDHARARAKAAGIRAALEKPVPPAELVPMIEALAGAASRPTAPG